MSHHRRFGAAALTLGIIVLGFLAYGVATDLLTAAQAVIGASILVVPVVAALALRATGATGIPAIAERRRWAVRRYYMLRDLRAQVEEELIRGRRYDRGFVLARVTLEAAGVPFAPHHRASLESIEARLRRVDRAWVDDRHVYLLLPESDRRGAQLVAQRLLADFGLSDLRLAAFPQDGVTVRALLAMLAEPAAAADLRRATPQPVDREGRRDATLKRGDQRGASGPRRARRGAGRHRSGRREGVVAIDQPHKLR